MDFSAGASSRSQLFADPLPLWSRHTFPPLSALPSSCGVPCHVKPSPLAANPEPNGASELSEKGSITGRMASPFVAL